MNIGIYKITSPSGKIYIGQSWDLNVRIRYYKSSSCKNQRKLCHSLKKYGWSSHKFEVLLFVSENISQQFFDDIEQTYINYYRESDYNMMNLRDAGSRGRHSEESKLKMSNVRKGVPQTEEARRINSESHKGIGVGVKNSFYGKKHSEETRLKMRLSHLSIQKGKDHPNFGKSLSDETKRKISESRKKTNEIIGVVSYNIKPVLQYDHLGNFIRRYPSITNAQKINKINNISNVCNGKSKTAGGFVWKYEDKLK